MLLRKKDLEFNNAYEPAVELKTLRVPADFPKTVVCQPQRHLDFALSKSEIPSQEMLDAARAALKRLDARTDETCETWSDVLAADLGAYRD